MLLMVASIAVGIGPVAEPVGFVMVTVPLTAWFESVGGVASFVATIFHVIVCVSPLNRLMVALASSKVVPPSMETYFLTVQWSVRVNDGVAVFVTLTTGASWVRHSSKPLVTL